MPDLPPSLNVYVKYFNAKVYSLAFTGLYLIFIMIMIIIIIIIIIIQIYLHPNSLHSHNLQIN